MKNTIIVIAIIVFTMTAKLVNADSVILSGDSQTKFGTYQLSSSNPVVIDDVAYKTWELFYTGSGEKYLLFFVPGKDGNCCFTVRNERFEIQYAFTKEKFGVKWVDSDMRTIKKNEVMKQISVSAFESQSVLATSQKSEDEYLGLIACFMPLLFN